MGLLGLLIPLLRRDKDEMQSRWYAGFAVNIGRSSCSLLGRVQLFAGEPGGGDGALFLSGVACVGAAGCFMACLIWLDWFGATASRKHPASQSAIDMVLAGVINVGMVAVGAGGFVWLICNRRMHDLPEFAADTAVPNEINAQFDNFVVLRGYEVSATAVAPRWFDHS